MVVLERIDRIGEVKPVGARDAQRVRGKERHRQQERIDQICWNWVFNSCRRASIVWVDASKWRTTMI